MATTPFELRPYQVGAADAVSAAFERSDPPARVLYVLPTGTGKTVVFAELIRRFRREPLFAPALVLAHREELLSQARDMILEWMPGSFVDEERADKHAVRGCDVIVASVPTLARVGCDRLAWLAAMGTASAPLTIIIDEAHHVAADGYQNILHRFGAYSGTARLIGCTATPHRLDRRGLVGPDETFESCVYEYELLSAIRDGYLCDLRGYRVVSKVCLDTVGTALGDFKQNELANAVRSEERTGEAITHWQKEAANRPTIVFCADVAHAESACAMFVAQGVTAECMHGGLHPMIRENLLLRFRTGRTQVVTNVDVLTEGFDHPPTSCILMLRPTKSWGKYAQMVGRGTRLSPVTGKADCLIMDVVDNTTKHDLATAPTLINLPAGFDLEGATLGEADDRRETLLAGAPDRRVAEEMLSQTRSLSELSTMLEEARLFRNIMAAKANAPLPKPKDVQGEAGYGIRDKEVESRSQFAWVACGAGGYLLGLGRRRQDDPGSAGERIAYIARDVAGGYRLHTTEEFSVHFDSGGVPCGEGAYPAFSVAEARLKLLWGTQAMYGVALRSAKWRGQPPSPAQSSRLRSLRITTGVDLTAGTVSDLIMKSSGLTALRNARAQLAITTRTGDGLL